MAVTPGPRDRSTTRTSLRVAGVVVLLAGLGCTGAGLVSFFSSFGELSGPPQHFWLAFVGLPPTVVGLWLLMAGFLGAGSRYVAQETVPVLRDSLGYLTGTAPADQPRAGTFCPKCGTRADTGASYCDRCGTALPQL